MSPFRASAAALAFTACIAGAVPAVSQDRPGPDLRRAGDWSRSDCRGLDGHARVRCERERAAWRDRERERDRDREEKAKKDGVIKGVVGAAIVGGLIAALANDKKKDERSARARYCLSLYGNYDERTDSYRASDGRTYRCQ